MRSAHLRRNRGRFYVDTAADVSLIKQECLINGVINTEKLVTIGSISVELSGLLCEAHIIPNDFPIDTDGLLEWNMLAKHYIKVNAANKCLEGALKGSL